MAVRRAPATLCPISSPLSPSLTSLFLTLFFFPFFFLSRSSASSYLRYTYFVNETVLLAPLPLRSTDISISTFVILSRIFTLPRFSAITFRNAASFPPPPSPRHSLPMIPRLQTIPSNTFSTSRSFMFVGLLDKRGGKSGGLLSRPTPRNPRPCICDTAAVSVLRTVSPVDYLRLLPHLIPAPSSLPPVESITEVK